MNPPASGQVANTYNSAGEISKQVITTGSTNEEQDFAYASNSTVANGTQTTVTSYPSGIGGTSTTTTYVYSNGVEVSETNGTGATTSTYRDPATLDAKGFSDADGNYSATSFQNYAAPGGTPISSANVTSTTDGAGNTTQTEYTPANLPWCSVDAADYANGTRCPTTEPTSPPTPGTYQGYTLDIYNSANELTYSTDPLGNTTAYAYTSPYPGEAGGLNYCTVDPVDYAKGVICPAYAAPHVVGTATKDFDLNGDALSSTDAVGNTTYYDYGSLNPGLPTETIDPDGTQTVDSYNAQGETLTQVVTNSSGSYSATTQYAYDSSGRKWCEVDASEYASGVTCPASEPTTPPTGTPGYTDTIYNSDGQVISTTNPIGGTTQHAYDGNGNQYCTVSPSNYVSGSRCPTSLPLTTPTIGSDDYQGATIDTFDADNRVIQTTNPIGGITLLAYDANGNPTQTTVESNNATADPNVVTRYGYDADNRVTSTTQGYGSSTPATSLAAYDPNGNAFCTVSANSYAAGSLAYQCPSWQSGWIVAPPSPASLYSTSPTSTQANNVTATFANADGTQVQSTNPDTQTTLAAVDADQRTYCTSDPVNVSSWLTANPSGSYPYLCPTTPPTTAPTSTTGYSTTIYDADGHTLSSTDKVGDTTAYTYDSSGHTLTTTDPRGKVTTNCYYGQSGTGQCAAAAPVGGGSPDDLYSTTTPATSTDPSGETTTMTYYPGDATHATTTPAGTTTDSYDANEDLTGVDYSGTASGYTTSSNQSFTFNPDGTRHTMVDATGTTTYFYDDNGDIYEVQLAATSGSGLANSVVSYGYFSTGVRSYVEYPTVGSTEIEASYTYDALGNMATVTDGLGNQVAFSHDRDGNLTSQDNSVILNPSETSSTTYSYDNADESTQATSSILCGGTAGSLIQSFSGTGGSRNADGQVTKDSESYTGSCAGPGSYQRDYSYDQAGRVVYQGTVAQGASPNNVAYDSSGDPTTISSHDGSGNFDTYTQAFDSAGEIQSQTPISGSQGVTATYTDDTLGAQTQAVAGSTTTSFGYNQSGQMTSTSQGNSSAAYNYTGDGLEGSASSNTSTVWTPPSAIDSTRAIKAISCTSASFCVAVGASGYATTYNGTSWSTPVSADSTRTLDAVSCTSATFCAAVDTSGYTVTYNGTTWSTPADTDGTRSLNAVKCVSASFCVAVGASGYASTYNGTSWSAASDVDSTRSMDAVSCASASFCMAVDTSGYAAKYTGSWAAATDADSTRSINAVDCVNATFCIAVGASGFASTFNGTTWSSLDVDSTRTLTAVSCPPSAVVSPGSSRRHLS